jgi:PAS domain S-box-containing protein
MTEILLNSTLQHHPTLSEQRLLSILQMLPEAVGRTLPDMTLTFANDKLCKILLKTAEELLHKSLLEFVPYPNQEAFIQAFNTCLYDRQTTEQEVVCFDKQNRMICARRWQFIPILDDSLQIAEVQIIAVDIDEYKELEETLRKSESKFRNYLETAPEGIFILDKAGKFKYANSAGAKLLGYSIDDFKGLIFANLISKFDLPIGLDEVFLLEKRDKINFEAVFLKKSRKTVPVLLDIARVSENSFICFVKDITKLKKNERAIRKAKHKAETDVAVKSQFLSTMSHEIRTPMNAVIAMTHLLLQDNPRIEQIKHLNILKFSAENLLVLINDILDYNKIEAGKIVFEAIEFDIRSLLHTIRDGLQYKANAKDIEIILDIDVKIPTILIGDTVRLSQILINLLDNAIKFTQEGHIKLQVKAGLIGQEYSVLDFSVADTGIGIETNKLEAIFERFTQATAETTRKFGGTGLGLAIVKKLLELQDSRIYVESELGKGTKFYFQLPFKNSLKLQLLSIESHINLGQAEEHNLQGVRILLVEDNEINQLVANQFLQKWNASVAIAENGAVAVEMVQTQSYDIVLMDLEMPVMNGYKATGKIRKLGENFTTLPIIALTASAFSEVKHRVYRAGMNDYVTKPFNPDELYQKLKKNLKPQNLADTLNNMQQANPETDVLAVPDDLINYQKIVDISGGNKSFIKRYNELAIKLFTEYPQEYEQAFQEKNLERLRKISHNARATIGLLEFTALDDEIKKGKKLLQDSSNLPEIAQNIRSVKLLCRKVLLLIPQD